MVSELKHDLAIKLLKYFPINYKVPELPVKAGGIEVRNPVGLAAGFDKHGEAIKGLLGLGFGFIEIGGVTPNPQPGNPKPRLFKLREDRAVINRMGFNSHGVEVVLNNLIDYRKKGGKGIVGVNLAKNKYSLDAVNDFEAVASAVSEFSDFVTVNVSSPNTTGLRSLQKGYKLQKVIDRVYKHTDKYNTPIWIKISPDLTDHELDELGQALMTLPIRGIVISNTTIKRALDLQSVNHIQVGGLSGYPLKNLSTRMVTRMREIIGNSSHISIIGVGGIENVDDVIERVDAGANLVQLYTGLVYHGLTLPKRIINELGKDYREVF